MSRIGVQIRGMIDRYSSKISRRQKWIVGLTYLLAVVVLWVMSSVLVSDLLSIDDYQKPFFITYLNTACFTFYLIPYLIRNKLGPWKHFSDLSKSFRNGQHKILRREDEDYRSAMYGSDENLVTIEDELAEDVTDAADEVGLFETTKIAFQFCILWFLANLVTNASLSYTSVASQTILSSTSSFFTLLLGFLYSVEKLNRLKIYGITMSFIGVIIITKIDSSSPKFANSTLKVVFGNSLALSGALIYGFYTILLKFKTTIKGTLKERKLDTQLFFAYVGIFDLFLLFPVIILLHFLKWESFELPSNRKTLSILLINMFITFVSDYCWCNAVLMTSPLTVTTGLSLTIPFAMVCDWFIRGFSINILYLSGAVLVTLGFLIINRDEQEDFVIEESLT